MDTSDVQSIEMPAHTFDPENSKQRQWRLVKNASVADKNDLITDDDRLLSRYVEGVGHASLRDSHVSTKFSLIIFVT